MVYGPTAEDTGRSVGVFWGFRVDLPQRSAVRKVHRSLIHQRRTAELPGSRRIAEVWTEGHSLRPTDKVEPCPHRW